MARPPDRSADNPDSISDVDMDAWMREFGPGLRRYFAKRAGAADAEDLVQEVFLRLKERARGQGDVADVRRYLFTVAHRVLIVRHRRETSRRGLGEAADTELTLPFDVLDPERIVVGRQEYQRMIVALQKLPPRAKEAFIFHRFDELSYGAIARRMDISVVAVRKLISRAAERIAAVMEGRA